MKYSERAKILILIVIFIVLLSLSCEKTEKINKKSYIQSSVQEVFNEGSEVPDLKLESLNGEFYSLSDFSGKFILLNLWASWCVPCVKELPALENLNKKMDQLDFEVVSINLDPAGNLDTVKKMIKEMDISFMVLLDPELHSMEKFRVSGLPETFFISSKSKFMMIDDPVLGKRVLRILSDREWDKPEFISAIQKEINLDT